MEAGDIHALAKIEAVRPVALRAGIEMQVSTPLLLRQNAQPID